MPLSRYGGVDELKWSHEKRGVYTVKSGYEILHNQKIETRRMAISTEEESLYACIRALDLPMKLRIFAWRLTRNILPTQGNLIRRGIQSDDRCVHCGEQGESVLHLLTLCRFAKEIWSLSNLRRGQQQDMETLTAWFEAFVANTGRLGMTQGAKAIVWTCWELWLARNKIIFEGVHVHPLQLIQNAREGQSEWNQHKEPRGSNDSGQQTAGSQQGPIRPTVQASVLKCSIGGSWTSAADNTGLDWILWDNTGSIIEVEATRDLPRQNALLTEAMALLHAIEAMLCWLYF